MLILLPKQTSMPYDVEVQLIYHGSRINGKKTEVAEQQLLKGRLASDYTPELSRKESHKRKNSAVDGEQEKQNKEARKSQTH